MGFAVLVLAGLSAILAKHALAKEGESNSLGFVHWATMLPFVVAIYCLIKMLDSAAEKWDAFHVESPAVAWGVLACVIHSIIYAGMRWAWSRKRRIEKEGKALAEIRKLKYRLGEEQ